MIVFDLDGTLSIVGDRLKYLQQTPKNWDAFYAACGEDEVNWPIFDIYKTLVLNRRPGDVKVVTGRRESCRSKTISWFKEAGIYLRNGHLIMRQDGDKRPDYIVKHEIVKPFIDKIELVFEDRSSVVAMWRELGITCCQVAEGEF